MTKKIFLVGLSVVRVLIKLIFIHQFQNAVTKLFCFMTAPNSVFMVLLGKNFVANLDAANILPDLVFGAERSNVCFSTSLHIGGQRA